MFTRLGRTFGLVCKLVHGRSLSPCAPSVQGLFHGVAGAHALSIYLRRKRIEEVYGGALKVSPIIFFVAMKFEGTYYSNCSCLAKWMPRLVPLPGFTQGLQPYKLEPTLSLM